MEDAGGRVPEEEPQHPPVLDNRAPASVTAVFFTGVELLQQYGWVLLLVALAMYYLWNKLHPRVQQWQQAREDGAAKKYDEGEVMRRTEAMMLAREKMQAELDAKAEHFMEEKKRKEEEKRRQKIEDWDRHQEGKGYRSKYKPQEPNSNSSASGSSDSKDKPKKKPLRPADYNPLMGDSSGFSYRPSRPASGGG